MNKPQETREFPEAVIDRVIAVLEIEPSNQHTKTDGSITTVKEEVWQRLNFIKGLFSDPDRFDSWVPPAKIRNLLKKQHGKIRDALDVLRSLNGMNLENTELSKKPNLIRRWLYEVSEINPALSGGLIGYDVVNFDKDFSRAAESLEKIEGHFSSVLVRAESSVKGRGKTKPENPYADHLLGSLCQLYTDVTGEKPKASIDDTKNLVRGNLVKFLKVVLHKMPYPFEITPTALEIRIRRLKTHETYAHLWEDTKR